MLSNDFNRCSKDTLGERERERDRDMYMYGSGGFPKYGYMDVEDIDDFKTVRAKL